MATISDIAKELNISISTVSRALNNKNDISEKTKEKVIKKAKELNYIGNINARRLASRRSKTIGIFFLSRNSKHLVENTALKYIEVFLDEVKKQGYDLHLFSTELDNTLSFSRLSAERGIEGAIVIGMKREDKFFKDSLDYDIPIVFMEKLLEKDESSTSIVTDNIKGIHLGLDYLISLKHKKIGFLGDAKHGGLAKLRLDTFIDYMKNRDLYYDNYVFQGDLTLESGLELAIYIARLRDRPSAIFASNDLMAIGLIKGLTKANIKVPEEISVLGFDGFEIGSYIQPGLTTIKQDFVAMAKKGIEVLFQMINGDRVAKGIYFEPQLLIRDSCIFYKNDKQSI